MLTLRMAGVIGGLLLASACQSPATTKSAASVSKPPTHSASSTSTPALVPTTATTGVSTPTPTFATGSSATPVDVAGAQLVALGLIVADPSLSGHWVACSNAGNWAACPLSVAVKARLADLTGKGYFGDGTGCGEEYISGTQNGLNNGPKALSAVVGANGSVTVVIQRGLSQPNLSAVMTTESGTWLASDLASGTGSSASIFSAKPNC